MTQLVDFLLFDLFLGKVSGNKSIVKADNIDRAICFAAYSSISLVQF